MIVFCSWSWRGKGCSQESVDKRCTVEETPGKPLLCWWAEMVAICELSLLPITPQRPQRWPALHLGFLGVVLVRDLLPHESLHMSYLGYPWPALLGSECVTFVALSFFLLLSYWVADWWASGERMVVDLLWHHWKALMCLHLHKLHHRVDVIIHVGFSTPRKAFLGCGSMWKAYDEFSHLWPYFTHYLLFTRGIQLIKPAMCRWYLECTEAGQKELLLSFTPAVMNKKFIWSLVHEHCISFYSVFIHRASCLPCVTRLLFLLPTVSNRHHLGWEACRLPKAC